MQLTHATDPLRPSSPTRSVGRRRVPVVALALAAVVLASMIVQAAPAGAATPVVPRGAALSKSASCFQGDIEITYAGQGVERQVTTFSVEDGRILQAYDVRAYAPNHDGVEYILSQTRNAPPAGTIVAVHVTIGTSPPDPASTGEFFVAYRCDSQPNSKGGNNVVVSSCVGLYGTCPKAAKDVTGGSGAKPTGSSATNPVALTATPRFTG